MTHLPRTTWILILLWVFHPARGAEVQHHGVWFEQWVCDTFFDGYRATDYTQKWDIPASANQQHGGLPVNPKAAKYRSPVALGDALRQFDIDEPFLLVVGFWEQSEPTVKRWVNLQAVVVTPALWRQLWHPLTRADLERLDAVVKDPSLTLAEARSRVQAFKAQPTYSQAVITLNPKIDTRQRRLQCSLSFQAFFTHLAPSSASARQDLPQLWGKPIPQVSGSSPRIFNQP